jgi:ASTRA-associated protein 1
VGDQFDYVSWGWLPFVPYAKTMPRHGRDHRLRAWQLTDASLDGETLDAQLPAEGGGLPSPKRREPWLLHSMAVSALNFCAFTLCAATPAGHEKYAADQAIIAVPNALDSGGIDFFNLPSERRVSVLKSDAQIKTGMVMALDVFHHPEAGSLIVISGYEDGRTMVHRRRPRASPEEQWKWETILISRPHSQPVLSLDTTPSKAFYFTSSADAMIAKFAIPTSSVGSDVDVIAAKISNTKHAGQQDLTVRDDGKIFATAGWDGRIRVYSAKTLKELAVLKWHQGGCYSVAFADSVLHDGPELSSEVGREGALVAPMASTGSALEAIRHQRNIKAQMTHWLAAGGKDGKISLWDIY